jgi:hypothetical protein
MMGLGGGGRGAAPNGCTPARGRQGSRNTGAGGARRPGVPVEVRPARGAALPGNRRFRLLSAPCAHAQTSRRTLNIHCGERLGYLTAAVARTVQAPLAPGAV